MNMKKILISILLLIPVLAFSQATDATLTNQSNTEIRKKVYSPVRAADMLQSIINAKASRGETGTGVFRELLEQTGNSSSTIKVRLAPSHDGALGGQWATSTTYYKGDIKQFPPDGPLIWKCITTSVNSNTPPDLDPTNWQLDIAPEMIQDIGGGKYIRTSLQTPFGCQEPGWTKFKKAEVGSYVPSFFKMRPQTFSGPFGIYGASTTSNSIPSAAGDSRTFTIETGKALTASTTLGTCTNTFSIPTAVPTTMTRNLPTGLSLVAGETVTFYANSTNMVTVVVVKYSSTTGIFNGFSVAHGGSGSFSSWTVKKEQLLYIFRDNEESAKNFYCTVQSYNSGSGSLTVTNISANGSGTFTNWAWNTGKVCPSVWLDASQGSYFNRTPVYGHYFLGSAVGTGVTHNSQTDNRGTKWRYFYISGPSAPSEAVVDTYSSSLVSTNHTPVWQNLIYGTHYFIAVAEENSVGASSQAWVAFSTNANNLQTNSGLIDWDEWTTDLTIGFTGDAQAAGEFIFKGKATAGGGSIRTWMPFHGDHAENNLVRTHTVDGVTVDISSMSPLVNPYLYQYQAFTEMVLNQSGTNINEDQGGATIATYNSTHKLNRYGLEFDITWTPAVSLDMDQGYSILVEMSEAFMIGGDVKAEDGTVMKAPATQPTLDYMSSDFKGQATYVARGAGAGANYALGWLYKYPIAMWRVGLANEGPHQFQWRAVGDNGGGFKVRTYPIISGTVPAGVPIVYGGRFYAGLKGLMASDGEAPVSNLLPASSANTINNTNHIQEWQWNSLAGNKGLKFTSNSTAAASNAQTLLSVELSGANATSAQTTIGASVSNTHTGTTSKNIALQLVASGGSQNLGLDVTGYSSFGTGAAASHVDTRSLGASYNGVTDITLTDAYFTVGVDASGANRTVTLPPANPAARRIYVIKKLDSSGNTVTIDGDGSETIDGATTKVISTQYAGVMIQSDGTNWIIISTF